MTLNANKLVPKVVKRLNALPDFNISPNSPFKLFLAALLEELVIHIKAEAEVNTEITTEPVRDGAPANGTGQGKVS